MRYRRLGRTGLKVSEVGFGGAPAGIANYVRAWDPASSTDVEELSRSVHRAIDLGYTMFDAAPAYGNGRGEDLLGSALDGRHGELVVATKTAWRGLHESEISESIESSLRRLRRETIDVLQIHGNYEDVFTPADLATLVNDGVLAAYERAREQGKIRFVGITCEYPLSLVPLVASGHFDTVQIKYNLAYQDAYHHLIPLCERLDIGVLVMRPNTSGILQKYLQSVAKGATSGLDVDALSLNYVLSDRRVSSALVGMRSSRSVVANARLSDDETNRVDLDWLHERNANATRQPWRAPDRV